MAGLISFMNSTAGRLLRIILGLVLIWAGLTQVGGVGGYIVAIIGLVPLLFGLMGRCLLQSFAGK